MESTCTAAYISLNKCPYTGWKRLFKSFNGWGTDRNIRGYNGQNSAETQCRGFWVLESGCHGFSVLESRCIETSSFCRILTLMLPDITTSSKFFHRNRLFYVLYLLFNTVIAMAIARKAVERISIPV